MAKARAEIVALCGVSSRTGYKASAFDVRRNLLCLLMQELDEVLMAVPALEDADAKDLLIEFGEGLSRLALGGGMRNTFSSAILFTDTGSATAAVVSSLNF